MKSKGSGSSAPHRTAQDFLEDKKPVRFLRESHRPEGGRLLLLYLCSRGERGL